MNRQVRDIFMFTGMFATVERTEELATGTNNTPLSQCVHIVIVRVVNSIILKIGNTLLIIESIRTVRTPDNPKIIQIGRLDNNCIRCLFLDLLSTKIKYLPGCILLYGFDLGKFFRQLFAGNGNRHRYIMPFIFINKLFLYPMAFTNRVEGTNNLLPFLTTQTLT